LKLLFARFLNAATQPVLHQQIGGHTRFVPQSSSILFALSANIPSPEPLPLITARFEVFIGDENA
jgi:hypothetical protein